MKRLLIFCVLLLAFALQVSASIITVSWTNGLNATFANSGSVPDNDFSGWSDTRNLSGYTGGSALVDNVSVTLNITGGWNGDLYGYLVHDSGFVVLLDRVGSANVGSYGYGDAGMSVTLGSTGANGSIQTYGGNSVLTSPPSGSYSTITTADWNSFDGLSVNGNWTLFLADLSSGDISQVTSWSLTIDAVPEPTTWAMMIFAAAFGCWRFAQRQTKRR